MAQGWQCEGYDLNEQPHYPAKFIQKNALDMTLQDLMDADFLVASSPCENFSIHCMKHFHKNPPHPVLGLKLFNHTRDLFEASGKPYIMENVRCAERLSARRMRTTFAASALAMTYTQAPRIKP
jgi:DNA (cytosine-5)-methyltransferase 1